MSPARETATAQVEERRSTRRYPVGLNLRYKLSRYRTVLQEGSGKTRDFSEGGVFFEPLQPAGVLPAGSEVELCLDWPTRINGKAAVAVAIKGRIVRSSAEGIAVKISRCDVRAHSEYANRR